jgi:archaetidylinositol phosphate synthase
MERRLDSISADLESRYLRWLAHHMPRWVQPGHLTLLGLVAMFMAGVSSAAARAWPAGLLVAIIWIALNWFGDSLDGTLARVRKQERPRYGYYVDHVADSFGVLFLFGGLAYSGYMSSLVAFAVVIGYFLLAINMYLAAYSIGVFQLLFLKFGPTELRVLLSIGNVISVATPIRVLSWNRATVLLRFGSVCCGRDDDYADRLGRVQHQNAVSRRAGSIHRGGLKIRWIKFNAVGVMGMGVQLCTLTVLVHIFNMHYLWATALAVEAAILHNFLWHLKWTCSDRTEIGLGAFLRFNTTAGIVSIPGNALLAYVFVSSAALDPVLGNFLSILSLSVINFWFVTGLCFPTAGKVSRPSAVSR